LFDAVVLFAALAAMGQPIPVRGVVVAYTLGQLVSAIPILPGGGGTIEATISAGLVVAGGTAAAVIAAVLLYRIVSAWAGARSARLGPVGHHAQRPSCGARTNYGIGSRLEAGGTLRGHGEDTSPLLRPAIERLGRIVFSTTVSEPL
jgi:hypothetical protein